tara:strand:- start:81 stop:587 length:507 start_codon:yes stop_codon:yes gene_type:complete
MANPLYGQNKFDNSVGEKLYSEAGTLREHENTVTAADIASYTIPANKLEVGDIVRIKAFCTVVDTNSTDTLLPVLNFAGSAIATGAALNVDDNDIVYAWADVHVTSSTAMTAIAEIRTDANGGTSVTAATNLSSKDITADIAVALNVDWSVAHADNEVRIDAFSVELV